MKDNIKREIKVFAPLFAAIIIFIVALIFVGSGRIPISFGLDGSAVKWIAVPPGSDTFARVFALGKYSLPIAELISYILLSIVQIKFFKNDKAKYDFIFYLKLGLVIFFGTTIPFAKYLFGVDILKNAWYLFGPAFGGLVLYVFIDALTTGALPSSVKSKNKGKRLIKRGKSKI